jgi:hypothetical protein
MFLPGMLLLLLPLLFPVDTFVTHGVACTGEHKKVSPK